MICKDRKKFHNFAAKFGIYSIEYVTKGFLDFARNDKIIENS